MANLASKTLVENTSLVQKAVSAASLNLTVNASGVSGDASDLLAALADKAAALKNLDLDRWANSPFQGVRDSFIQSRSSRIGVPFASAIFQHAGLATSAATTVRGGVVESSQKYDLVVSKLGRVSVHLSTEGITGMFNWSRMSPSEADYFLLLGVSPLGVVSYLIPAEKMNRIFSLKERGVITPSLSRSLEGKYSASFKTSLAPAWISPFGGNLDATVALIKKESRRRR